MKKTYIIDTTFLIPVRQDSIDQLENILAVIAFFKKKFITNTTVLKSALYDNRLLKILLGKDVRYEFIEDADPIFYRTKYINHMGRHVNSPYVAVWDTDVIVSAQQIEQSVEKLRRKDVH